MPNLRLGVVKTLVHWLGIVASGLRGKEAAEAAFAGVSL